MPRSGEERWAYLKDVIVTAGALQPRLEPGIAIAVIRDGPSGPSALHREEIVHGAVGPSNIMLSRTGNAKLIDIGAAFARDDAPLARRPTSRPTS
jgi:serine/threonine-protein kinase